MRTTPKAFRKAGFTLIEMSLALALSIGIAAVIISMLSQQVSFARALGEFRFLRDEAPQVNTLVTNIVYKADKYRIFPNLDSAKAFQGAVRTGGTALRLRFRHPGGGADHAIICFENRNGEDQLNYYFRSNGDSGWSDSPGWTISKQPSSVEFDNSTGILLITLRGDSGDEITYAGTPD